MPISLEQELEVEKLKLYLENYPHKAFKLAINHFHDWLEERNHNKDLWQRYIQLQQDYLEVVQAYEIMLREKS